MDIESRLTAIETALKNDVAKTKTWIESNWAHFVTWAGLAFAFVKHLI